MLKELNVLGYNPAMLKRSPETSANRTNVT